MKKVMLICVAMLCGCMCVLAGPNCGGRGGRGRGGHCGPPPRHHHHGGGSSGVRLATDIVNLVGASLDLIAPTVVEEVATPVVVSPQPAVVPVTPVQPVYTQPVYTSVPSPGVVYTAPVPCVSQPIAPTVVYYQPRTVLPPPPRYRYRHRYWR